MVSRANGRWRSIILELNFDGRNIAVDIFDIKKLVKEKRPFLGLDTLLNYSFVVLA